MAKQSKATKTVQRTFRVKIELISREQGVCAFETYEGEEINPHLIKETEMGEKAFDSLCFIFEAIHRLKSGQQTSSGIFNLVFSAHFPIEHDIEVLFKLAIEKGYQYESSSFLNFGIKIKPEDFYVKSV